MGITEYRLPKVGGIRPRAQAGTLIAKALTHIRKTTCLSPARPPPA